MIDQEKGNNRVKGCDFEHLEWLVESVAEGAIIEPPNHDDLRIIGIDEPDDNVFLMVSDFSDGEIDKLVSNIDKVHERLSKDFKPNSAVYSYFSSWLNNLFIDPAKQKVKAKLINQIHDSTRVRVANYLNDYIQYKLTIECDLNVLLKRVLVSACAFDGLSSRKQLEAFYKELTKKQPQIYALNNDIYLDLHYNQAGHATNIKANDVKQNNLTSLRRLFLGPLSQLVALEFLREKARQTKTVESKPPKFKFSDFKDIIRMIYQDMGVKTSDISITKLLPQMFDSALQLTKIKLPQFLRTYAVGQVFSGSTEPESLQLFCTKTKVAESVTSSLGQKKNNFTNIRPSGHNTIHKRVNPSLDKQLLEELEKHCLEEFKTLKKEGVTPAEQMKARERLILAAKDIYDQRAKMSLQAEILLAWIYQGLQIKVASKNRAEIQGGAESSDVSKCYRWEIGKGTPHRYLSIIREQWLEIWNEYDIDDVGESEIQYIYHFLIAEISPKQKLVKDIVSVLFNFIADNYVGTVVLPPSLSEGQRKSHVRSQLVPEAIFQQARKDMLSQIEDRPLEYKRCVDLIMILAYRCAFRPMEIYQLKVNDVSLCGEYCIILRGKTDSAPRNIPFSLLLLPAELKLFKAYVYGRKVSNKLRSDQLLFSKSLASSIPFDYDSINRNVTQIVSSYSPIRTVFYQFRHTAISLLMTVCFCDLKTARSLTAYSDDQLRRIREYYCADPRKSMYQLSAQFGHLSPKTTLSCYCHLTDLCLNSYLKCISTRLPIRRCTKIVNRTRKELKDAGVSEKNGQVEIHAILTLVYKEFRRFLTDEFFTINEKPHYEFDHMRQREPNLEDLQEILGLANAGETDERISECLNINLQWIKQVKIAAQEIKDADKYTTKKGKSTIVRQTSGFYPVPRVIPLAHSDDAITIFNALTVNTKKAEQQCNVVSEILQTSLDHSYLLFKTATKVNKFIGKMEGVISPDRWFITFDWQGCRDADADAGFKKLLEAVPERNINGRDDLLSGKHFKKGYFQLRFLRPLHSCYKHKADKATTEKYGSNSLRVAIFYALVYRDAKDKLDLRFQDDLNM